MLKSMIQQLEERRSFGAMVSSPGLALPETLIRENPRIPVEVQMQPANRPETATTLSGVVLSRLTSLKPSNPELKARLQEVIGEAASLLADADALVQECENERLSNLERRHDEIRAQGRKQQALVKKLEKDEATALGFWNQAHETRQERQADLEQATEIQRGLSQWASKREELDAQILVTQAKEALRTAIEKDAQCLQAYNSAASAFESAKATLSEWGKVEEAILLELSGLPHDDPVLGLEVR